MMDQWFRLAAVVCVFCRFFARIVDWNTVITDQLVMSGCASVALLMVGSNDPPADPQEPAPGPAMASTQHLLSQRLQSVMQQHETVKQRLVAFAEASKVKRGSIMESFSCLRAAVDRLERGAIVDYDACVKGTLKRLELEAEGLEVLAQQLSARVLACAPLSEVEVESFNTLGHESHDPPTYVDIAVPFDALKDALGSCFAVVTSASDEFEEQVASSSSLVLLPSSLALDVVVFQLHACLTQESALLAMVSVCNAVVADE